MTELIPLLDKLRRIERHLLHAAPHETVIGRRRGEDRRPSRSATASGHARSPNRT
jgi:hypothetical protein